MLVVQILNISKTFSCPQIVFGNIGLFHLSIHSQTQFGSEGIYLATDCRWVAEWFQNYKKEIKQ